jgi:hypothetical protein
MENELKICKKCEYYKQLTGEIHYLYDFQYGKKLDYNHVTCEIFGGYHSIPFDSCERVKEVVIDRVSGDKKIVKKKCLLERTIGECGNEGIHFKEKIIQPKKNKSFFKKLFCCK